MLVTASRNAGGAHLERIGDRQRRLLFQRIDPAVPKLSLVVERVQNSWRVALTGASGDADRDRAAVGEGKRGIVASCAGDGAVTREPAVEEELFAERHDGRRERAAGRNDRLCQLHRKADLILRARLRQRSGFRQRRRLTRRERRRCAGFGIFAKRQRREERAQANRNGRGDCDQTGCCKSFARHRAVILIAVRSVRAPSLNPLLARLSAPKLAPIGNRPVPSSHNLARRCARAVQDCVGFSKFR